jgi:proline iminopeptidase
MGDSPKGEEPPLYHDLVGTGPPLLFMHGGPGWDHSYFRPWLDGLGHRNRLVFYDHRGNGRSQPDVDPAQLSHELWVADAEALRIRLGLGPTFVLGHSYGGFLALEYALRYPESVRGLILSNTAPVVDFPEVILENARRTGSEEDYHRVVEGLSQPMEGDDALRDFVDAVLHLYFHDAVPLEVRRAIARVQFRAAPFNVGMFQALGQYDVSGRLGDLQVPTLVLGGAHDWVMPVEHGLDRLVEGIPGARGVVFARSGHFPFMEEPEDYRSVVASWLANVEGAR